MPPTDCSICCARLNKTKRKPVRCPWEQHAPTCAECTRRYLLTLDGEAECMHCRRPWDNLVLEQMLPVSFLKGEWQGHQRARAAQRQMQLMGETAPLLARWKEAAGLREQA
mgnify:CR=1 FL=1